MFGKKKDTNLSLNYKERSNSRISLICSFVVFALLLAAFAWADYIYVQKPKQAAREEELRQQAEEEARAALPVTTTATVVAAGDNMFLSDSLAAGQTDPDNWNYNCVYQNIQSEITGRDLAIVCQENVITDDEDMITAAYLPPTQVGDSLVWAGFDVIASASNHVADYGFTYMEDTLNFWKENYPEETILGIHDSKEDAGEVKVVEVNGISIALLNYTYGSNSAKLEGGNEYALDVFDKSSIDSMIQEAKKKSDCIIFIAHWGTEDVIEPNEFEKQWAVYLMQQGVDVLIGSHPHVLQPYGWLSDDQGNEMLLYYSLGNLVYSEQSIDHILGGLAEFTIQKTTQKGEEDKIEILDSTLEPIVFHFTGDSVTYQSCLLKDYTEDLANSHILKSSLGDGFSLKALQDRFAEIMSMNVQPSVDTDEIK